MKNPLPRTIFLKDYQAPAFLIDTTDLRFELGEESTRVLSRLLMRRNPLHLEHSAAPLVLNGQNMQLESLAIDGRMLAAGGSRGGANRGEGSLLGTVGDIVSGSR